MSSACLNIPSPQPGARRVGLVRVLCALLLATPLAACGGSGGGIQAGRLLESAARGIAYETPTQSGVTDENGTFRYQPGETVRFSLGATLLGETAGQDVITPFDLAGAEPVVGNRAIKRALAERDSALGVALNIALLLQTFDQDGDPANGIEITADVSALLANGPAVDLGLSWTRIRHARPLRDHLNQANALGLLDDHRVLPATWRVAKQLYESVGVEQAAFVRPSLARDDGGNGSIDYRSTSSFDSQGRRIRRERDLDGNGSIDEIRHETRNAQGDLTRLEEDSDGNGTTDAITTFAYDDDGNRARIEHDAGADGSIDEIETFVYNAYGELVTHRRDTDANGVVDWLRHYEYDDRGNQTRRVEDPDGNGVADEITTMYYDADDNQTRWELDQGGDGLPDWIRTWEYDSRGNVIRKRQDLNASGFADVIDTYAYDANDNLVRTEKDEDGNGSVDRITVDTYDAANNLLRREFDLDANGTADEVRLWEYVDGHLVRHTVDQGADGSLDHIETSTYDSHGNRTLWEVDQDGNGMSDETFSYVYAGNGWWDLF